MAIFIAYGEGHRSDTGPATMTVAGLVASKDGWRRLDERWPRILRRQALSAFDGRAWLEAERRGAPASANGSRRSTLIDELGGLVRQSALFGCACTLPLHDYDAVNALYPFAQWAGSPYGVCAARVIANVQTWMAEHRPDDLTLFVFEEGETNHHDIRTLAAANGINRGEPVQLWPRQWIDERGRQRFLRPFEACDLLRPDCNSGVMSWLARQSRFQHETLNQEHLLTLCESLGIAARDTAGHSGYGDKALG